MMRHGLALSSYPATAALERALLLSAEKGMKAMSTTTATIIPQNGFEKPRSTFPDEYEFPVIEWPDDSPQSMISNGGTNTFAHPKKKSNDCQLSMNEWWHLISIYGLDGIENHQGILKCKRIFSGLYTIAEEEEEETVDAEMEEASYLKNANHYCNDGLEKLLRITPDSEISQVYVCA